MNKIQFITEISEEEGCTLTDGERMLNAFLDKIKDKVRDGERVKFVGFGTFICKKHQARNGRNPQNGKTIKIPARKKVRFIAGTNWQESLK